MARSDYLRKLPSLSDGTISLGGYPGVEPDSLYIDRRDMVYVPDGYRDSLDSLALEGVEQPETDGSEVAFRASRHFRKIIKALNLHLIRESGVKLRYKGLKIRGMKRRDRILTEDGPAEILGYYDTRTSELYLSPCLLELGESRLAKVAAHEIVHYAQDKLGIIGKSLEQHGPRNARTLIERKADELTDSIMPLMPDDYHAGHMKLDRAA